MYRPNPIDTSGIELPADLLTLTEQIAKNVHEVWASGRLSEGWRYGEQRDDSRKETPCLVPYEELTEQERDYDRHTALETLRTIIALGYRIEKCGAPAADEAEDA